MRPSRRRCSRAAGRRDTAPRRSRRCARSAATSCCAIAIADLARLIDLKGVGAALTDLTAATIEVALDAAIRRSRSARGGRLGGDVLVVAMGSLGGRELGYASDADVMFVHRAARRARPRRRSRRRATPVVQELRRLLSGSGPDPAVSLDADLRPEGKARPPRAQPRLLPHLLRALGPHVGVPGAAAGRARSPDHGAGRRASLALIDPLR